MAGVTLGLGVTGTGLEVPGLMLGIMGLARLSTRRQLDEEITKARLEADRLKSIIEEVKGYEDKKKSLEDLYDDTKDWVRQNPGKTLAGALATGFLIGRFLRRR